MKKYISFLAILITTTTFSQSINDYNYLIVPVKFDFQREENQYRLNTNTKFILEKQGFTVFFNNNVLPSEVDQDRCKAMYVDIVKKKSLLGTKLNVVLKDCQNNVLFESAEGRSKEKSYEKAYNEALTNALASFKNLKYKFIPKQSEVNSATVANSSKFVNEIPQSRENSSANSNLLFAQPTAQGFQLVDASPKIVLKLSKTSQQDFFIASSATNQGIVFSKNGNWFFEFYKDEKLVSEQLNIKF